MSSRRGSGNGDARHQPQQHEQCRTARRDSRARRRADHHRQRFSPDRQLLLCGKAGHGPQLGARETAAIRWSPEALLLLVRA